MLDFFPMNIAKLLRTPILKNIANGCFCTSYCSIRKGVLKICRKFTREHPCRSVISRNFQRNFIQITLRHGCPPVNLLHIFRTAFYKNNYGRLVMNCSKNLANFPKSITGTGYCLQLYSIFSAPQIF